MNVNIPPHPTPPPTPPHPLPTPPPPTRPHTQNIHTRMASYWCWHQKHWFSGNFQGWAHSFQSLGFAHPGAQGILPRHIVLLSNQQPFRLMLRERTGQPWQDAIWISRKIQVEKFRRSTWFILSFNSRILTNHSPTILQCWSNVRRTLYSKCQAYHHLDLSIAHNILGLLIPNFWLLSWAQTRYVHWCRVFIYVHCQGKCAH